MYTIIRGKKGETVKNSIAKRGLAIFVKAGWSAFVPCFDDTYSFYP